MTFEQEVEKLVNEMTIQELKEAATVGIMHTLILTRKAVRIVRKAMEKECKKDGKQE